MAIEKVKEYVNSARAEFPEITNELLDNDGKIYYMNGNDGTDFDWDWNDRLCEFVVFGKMKWVLSKFLFTKMIQWKVMFMPTLAWFQQRNCLLFI